MDTTLIIGTFTLIIALNGSVIGLMIAYDKRRQTDMSQLKEDLKADMSDLKSDMSDLKDELKSDMSDHKDDTKSLYKSLKKDMNRGFAKVDKRFDNLSTRLDRHIDNQPHPVANQKQPLERVEDRTEVLATVD